MGFVNEASARRSSPPALRFESRTAKRSMPRSSPPSTSSSFCCRPTSPVAAVSTQRTHSAQNFTRDGGVVVLGLDGGRDSEPAWLTSDSRAACSICCVVHHLTWSTRQRTLSSPACRGYVDAPFDGNDAHCRGGRRTIWRRLRCDTRGRFVLCSVRAISTTLWYVSVILIFRGRKLQNALELPGIEVCPSVRMYLTRTHQL